jgi:hypothetical protein
MGRLVRILAIAILIAASLNATAGLCFCHRGADSPLAAETGQSCCHQSTAAGQSWRGIDTCCHIESVQRDMTPVDVVHLTAPHSASTPTSHDDARLAQVAAAPSAPLPFASSPPVRNLRV